MLEPKKVFSQLEPFSRLPEKEREFLAKNLLADYVRRDEVILKEGEKVDYLFIIVKGTCVVKKGSRILDFLEKGDFWGASELLFDRPSSFSLKAVEDVILYMLPKKYFEELVKDYPEIKEFFTKKTFERLSEGYKKIQSESEDTVSLLTVDSLKLSPPIFCNEDDNLTSVAKKMVENGTSYCLVDSQEKVGIITDMDIKAKVVAEGKNPFEVKAKEIATFPVLTIESSCFVYEAIVEMINRNIKRLPVVKDGKIIGVLEDRDIFVKQAKNIVFLAREIELENSIEGLRKLYLSVEETIEPLFRTGKDILIIQRYLSELNDRFIRKAIELTLKEVGEPKGEFVFLVLGSEGRREQAIKTDIDNAIVYQKEEEKSYFQKFGEVVTEILLNIGFPECPGKVMVSNPEWVKSYSQWKYTLEEWFSRPDGNTILSASIFLDFRPIWGNRELALRLRNYVNKLAENYRNFLVAMTQKVLEAETPLNIFRHFILEGRGEHKGELNLKRGGIFLIVQGVRVLSLEKGLTETNTVERLKKLKSSIGEDFTEELIEAFKFMQVLRLKNHLNKISKGLKPDDYVNPKELSKFERDLLKDAFRIVSKFQEMLGVHFRLRL